MQSAVYVLSSIKAVCKHALGKLDYRNAFNANLQVNE